MKLICFFVVLLVLAVIVCSLILNRIVFWPVKTVNQKNCCEGYGDGVFQVGFKSGKNLLKGYIYGAENKTGIVVISHGMGVTSDYYMPEALWLVEHGYRVMTFDNTGYGENPGCFEGILQAVYDLRAAIKHAGQYGLPITLFGHSMGGYAVCAVLNYGDVTVDRVVSAAGFATIREMIHLYAVSSVKRFPSLVEVLILTAQFIRFGKIDKFSAIDGINKSCSKIVIAQGKNDQEVIWDRVSIHSKQEVLRKHNVQYLLFENGIHSTHMGIVRGEGDERVNEDLLRSVIAHV